MPMMNLQKMCVSYFQESEQQLQGMLSVQQWHILSCPLMAQDLLFHMEVEGNCKIVELKHKYKILNVFA
jgi:hypothetical protein